MPRLEHDTTCPDCDTKMTRHEGTIVTFTCPGCRERFTVPELELIAEHSE